MTGKTTKDTQTDGKQLCRFRFVRRLDSARRVLDFSLVINHRIENYYFIEGEEYEAPLYVIDHISKIKDVTYYSNAETKENRTIVTPLYHCEIFQ